MEKRPMFDLSSLVVLAATAVWFAAAGGAAAVPVRVDLLTSYPFEVGDAGNGDSVPVQATPDGGYLALTTQAMNLVAGFDDRNNATDALVLDRQSGVFEYVSVAFGAPVRAGQYSSAALGISDDGRWVLLASSARDLISGGSYPAAIADRQLYLFDRLSRTTRLVSHAPGNPLLAANAAVEGVRLSADGRFVLFETQATNLVSPAPDAPSRQVYLFDRNSDSVKLLSRAAGAPSTPGNGVADAVDLSSDGRFALFESTASNHLAGLTDANAGDVFVYDRVADAIQLISRQAGAPSTTTGGTARDLSADGRFVLLDSKRTAIAAGIADGNGADLADVFVFDRQSGIARLASPAVAAAATSATGHSNGYRLSDDGRFVYFFSWALNLVSPFTDGDPENLDLYYFDGTTGTVTLASHDFADPARGANGRVEPMTALQPLSTDGRYVLVESLSTNLQSGVVDSGLAWQLYLYDRVAGASLLVSRRGGSLEAGGIALGTGASMTIAGEAIFASPFPLDPAVEDGQSQRDVFRFDAGAAANEMLTVAVFAGASSWPQGWIYGGVITPDGSHAAFSEFAWDRDRGPFPERIAHAAGDPATAPNRPAESGAISPDGRFVAFDSSAHNLVGGLTDNNNRIDVFVYDRDADTPFLASHVAGQPDRPANSNSQVNVPGWISADGNRLALTSTSSNLVAGLTGSGSSPDLYFHDRATATTELISHHHTSVTQAGGRGSGLDDASADGRYLVYSSANAGLVPGFVDANDIVDDGTTYRLSDLYFYDRQVRTATLISHQPGLPSHGALEASPRLAFLTGDSSAVIYGLHRKTATESGPDKVYRWDRASNTSTLLNDVGGAPLSSCGDDAVLDHTSPDGRWVLITTACAFVPGDTNGGYDVYLIDLQAGQKALVTHAAGNPAIASGGRGERVGADGQWVIYSDLAGVPHAYDRIRREATRLTSSWADPAVAQPATVAGASADASYVLVTTFRSLVPEDGNGKADLYLVSVAEIFADGFEGGSTARWSLALP